MRHPRPYQLDAIAAVRREFERVSATVLVLPTGTGKTIIMAKLASEWTGGNVLVLAHRIELLDQAQDKIGAELGYLPVIEQGQRAADLDCMWQGASVVIGSVQTMCGAKRLGKFEKLPFGLILVDECHHATAASYRRIIDHFRQLNPALKVLGVTATPRRADNTALGLLFDTAAYELSIADAIDHGWLVPIRQEYVAVEDVDFSSVRSGQNEMGESDLKAADLEAVLVEEEALHAFARPIIEKAGDRQTLIFTAGVAHAHMLAAVLNRYRDGSAAAVDGETNKERRKEIVAAFAAGRLQFLANFGVFTEGFDVPPVALAAMARPTKSVSLYQQMLGRGTRPLDGVVDGLPDATARRDAIAASAKPNMLVLDFVGNSRHKLVSAVDILGGNYDVETRDLARRRIGREPGDVTEQLEKARADILLQREQAKRRKVKAAVSYSTEEVDPFGNDAAPGEAAVVQTRGGASDGQVGFLVNLGVEYATAAAYSRRQASAVIEKLKATRCTKKQKAVLAKYGEPTEVSFDEARARIDAIARNGWRPIPRTGPTEAVA